MRALRGGRARTQATLRAPQAVTVVVLASLLGGCSAMAAPTPQQTTATLHVSPSPIAPSAGSNPAPRPPTPYPSSTEAAPLVVGSFPQTDAGARDFTIAWFAALNAAYRDGDLRAARTMSGTECTACAQYLALIEMTTSDGGRLDVDAFLVDDVVAHGAETGVAELSFRYQVADVRIRRPGRPDDVVPGEPATSALAAVEWRDTGWVMGKVGR